MLTISVCKREQLIRTADGELMKIRQAFVRQGRRADYLESCPIFDDPTDIQIIFQGWFRTRELPQTEKLRRGIVQFFRRYHAKQDMSFDCYAFANLVHGIEPHKCRDLFNHWDARTYTGKIEVGEALFLMQMPENGYGIFCHAAIYIGRGLYISVYGAGGSLSVSTLKDMQDFYEHEAFVATPILKST